MNTFYKLLKKIFMDYKIKNLGDKEVYYIKIDNEVAGFFAILRETLDYCCYADEQGFLPYIIYSKRTLYSENGFFLGTKNPFEYYYEQPLLSMSDSIFSGLNLVKSRLIHLEKIEMKYNLKPFSYIVEDKYFEKMADIYRKYMHLNVMTYKKIEINIEKIIRGKRTLGVHIRGTDFYKEFNNHPVPVTVDEYIQVINEEAEREQYGQVFVATDDVRCLKKLKQILNIPLVFYKNTMRASGNKSVAYERSERKNNNYLLGYEVLKDAYTLAACDGFIGCLSQVDIFVQIIKKSKGQDLASLKIIDKGVFTNNRQCWEPSK